MNTVITLYDLPEEWYRDTYICCQCETEFMIDLESVPRFCPECGVKFDAIRIRHGGRTETTFIKDEEEEDEEN